MSLFSLRNPCYDRALTEDPSQQNYVSHFYFLHLIRVSLANIAMPFSHSDAIFLPNSGKFPSRSARGNKDFPRRNYISLAVVSRMLQAIPRQSFKRLSQCQESPSFSSHIMHYPSRYEETLPIEIGNVADFRMTFGRSDSIFFGTFRNQNFIFLRYTYSPRSSRCVLDPKFATKLWMRSRARSGASFSRRFHTAPCTGGR